MLSQPSLLRRPVSGITVALFFADPLEEDR